MIADSAIEMKTNIANTRRALKSKLLYIESSSAWECISRNLFFITTESYQLVHHPFI